MMYIVKRILVVLTVSGLLGMTPCLWAQGGSSIGRGVQAVRAFRAGADVSLQAEKSFSQAVLRSLSRKGAGKFQNSVFCGRGKKGSNAWSGSVFVTEEEGGKKIYGLVAAHSLAKMPTDFITAAAADYALHRTFQLEMFDEKGQRHTIPGKVVWLSSPLMWDVALVEFVPMDEQLFAPFMLSDKLPVVGDYVQQQGFFENSSVYIPNRRVIDITPLSFRTTMPFTRDKRVGLCGSPVFVSEKDELGREVYKLVGVHTGSALGDEPGEDIGYFTPSSFLRRFVEDYRSGGKMQFPITFRGKEMFSIAASEYIHSVVLFDDEGREITHHKFADKFSYRKVESLVDMYGPHELEFVIKRFQWAKSRPEYVECSKTSRRVRYSLRQGRIVSQQGYH